MNSIRSNSLSLKYRKCMQSGCKENVKVNKVIKETCKRNLSDPKN